MNNSSAVTSNNIIVGVLLSLLGYLAIALMSTCVKSLHHLPVSTIVFAQFFIGFLLTIPTTFKQGLGSLKTNHPYLMVLRAMTGMLSLGCMFFAIHYIPLVDAVLLQNTVPLFVPLILFFALKNKIPHRVWPGLIIGFIGVLAIIKPNAGIISPAAFIGLSAGFLSAVSVVSISVLKKTESSARITFYFLLIGTLVSAPFMLLHWTPLQGNDWLLLVATGLLLYIGQLLVTHGFSFGSAHALAPLSYSTVIFTGLLAWAIWQHIPDIFSIFGIILVCAGGVWVILMERSAKTVAVNTIALETGKIG